MTEATELQTIDLDRIEAISARLDLRPPNREALESIVAEIAEHFDIAREPPPLEAVVDSATGAGKTFILAAAIEYLAGEGVRDFAVIAPGRTILDKTVANFTPGHPKSLLGGMEVQPVVITAENFATPVVKAAMDDELQVKLYIFTVQALLKPETKVGRKTHKFQEGLGAAFYEHLQALDQLVVFADEHHTYYGSAFSRAVRDLHPRVLIGLTATPHKKTPVEHIIYRYPLAAAIADKLVKTPVLVGRRDDRSDPETKLLDGVRLLDLKEQAVKEWCRTTGESEVNPVMLVIAPSIAEAEEIDSIVNSASFAGGTYAGKVLTVHSDAPDQALSDLQELEEPASPYRIVISVGMLKEGWDVKSVYVIASLRASVSDLLTEQTLGRGLRLPFGRHTGIEILDTLEVLGHERYEDLLKKSGVLNEQFVDRQTRAVLRRTTSGGTTITRESQDVHTSVVEVGKETDGAGQALVDSIEEHTARGEQQVLSLKVELHPNPSLDLKVPILKMTPVRSEFSLADITEVTPFRALGERIAADPSGQLRRMRLDARIRTGPDGLRTTELVPGKASDAVLSPASLIPIEDARRQLEERVLNAPVVPARSTQRAALSPILDAFLKGLGDKAEQLLSGYLDRAAAGLIQLITDEHRKFAAKPTFDEVVEFMDFKPVRTGRAETSNDRVSAFKRGVGYEGYSKTPYAQEWFDSSTERAVANILDDADEVRLWVRLQRGDLPILWKEGREYNPDFLVVEHDESHWVVEVKMDKEVESIDVIEKRKSAMRWANHVNADEKISVTWGYLLLSETNVSTAKGSWGALKRLGCGD